MGSYTSRPTLSVQDVWRRDWQRGYACIVKHANSIVHATRSISVLDESIPALFRAVRLGDSSLTDRLLDSNVDISQLMYGLSALHVCCASAKASKLYHRLPPSLNSQGLRHYSNNDSASLTALSVEDDMRNYIACVQALVSKGGVNVVINGVSEREHPLDDGRGFTAIHIAAFRGRGDIITAIVENLAVQDEDSPLMVISAHAGKLHVAPIHLAALAGHSEAVQALLKAGAHVETVDSNSFTALHLAAWRGHRDVVTVLLESGARVDAQTGNGDTPLHLAAYSGHTVVAELILLGETTNTCNSECENAKSTRISLSGQADVNARDKEGYSPLHHAASRPGSENMLRYLLTSRFDPLPNAANVYGDTPLHASCYADRVDCARILVSLESGGIASTHRENIFSETPLHAACTAGASNELIIFLLSLPQADVNVRGTDGHTALHSACWHGHIDAARLLLQHGVNYRIKTVTGDTCVKWAYERGYDELVEMMQHYVMDVLNRHPKPGIDGLFLRDIFPTPSPLGCIRRVTREKAEILMLRGLLSEDKQIDYQQLELHEAVGSGSFGKVYRGVYKGIVVAVKRLRQDIGSFRSKSEVESFCHEVSILRELDHPNIIEFIGATCSDPSSFCIVTRYLAGGTLHDVLHLQKRALDMGTKLIVALDVALGMTYLHSLPCPIIHRDLNSHNVLLSETGRAHVADFGESRFSPKEEFAISMTKQPGNLRWMAPEVFTQSTTYSEKADIFSYALVIWEIMAAQLPFSHLKPAAAAAEMAYRYVRPSIPMSCPLSVSELIRCGWQEEPSQRPSFSDIVDLLSSEFRNHQINVLGLIDNSEGGIDEIREDIVSKPPLSRGQRKSISFENLSTSTLFIPSSSYTSSYSSAVDFEVVNPLTLPVNCNANGYVTDVFQTVNRNQPRKLSLCLRKSMSDLDHIVSESQAATIDQSNSETGIDCNNTGNETTALCASSSYDITTTTTKPENGLEFI